MGEGVEGAAEVIGLCDGEPGEGIAEKVKTGLDDADIVEREVGEV